jgi:signal transduction histidine kinase/DNA-binding response OmpR family regulator
LEKETTPPIFTDLKIDGVSFRDRKKNSLSGYDISATSKVHLNYGENTFSISYKSLDFCVEDMVFYETSMVKEGEKENWTTTYDTFRSWTNLNDGNYTFKVRKDNNNQVAVLNIIISPPWWRNTLAVVGYFVLLLIGIYLLVYVFTKKAVTKEKRIQDNKFNELRFKFFLNIAHEIRTPLTLIKGGVERLKNMNAVNKKYAKELNRVYKNTDRLYRLVNEVLDLKKIERTKVTLNLTPINLKWFLENIIDVFRFRESEMNLDFKAPKEPVWIKSDKQLLESIVYNLISNAIKYSESNTKIEVSLFKSKINEVSIEVKDYGYGIKKEEQQLIFERLYQSNEHLKTGTGIGLAIVKQYVELLKGEIKLKSEINKGSTFTVTLPYKESMDQLNENTTYRHVIMPNKKSEASILVIDDQNEMRTFVKEIFEKEYDVFEASNGEEGLRLAQKYQPSLIISDVMMPVMNGIEFCRKIRKNLTVSHIPIILLTAKTGDEVEIESLSSGADAYVNKPFNQETLKSRVKVLIENRKKLIKKYSLSTSEDLAVLASNDMDKEFLDKFEVVLQKRYEYSDLSIEELASEMAVSVSGFYTKIKSITGNSPVEFVRTYRLKKAAQLLKSTNMSVTEISERVGFGTQKYFSNSFKKYFGMSPLNYRKV